MAVSSPSANGRVNSALRVEHEPEGLSEPRANANGTVGINGVSHELEPHRSQGPNANANATVLIPCRRHKHALREQALGTYKCSGCKEHGGQVGFKCESCPLFILHDCCNNLFDAFTQMRLGETFHFRPKTSFWTQYCEACGDMLKGFVFETEGDRLGRNKRRLHPWCLNLLELHPTLQFQGHADHILKLDENNSGEFTCSACRLLVHSGCWRYTCRDCDYNVDMSCAKIQISSLDVVRVAPRRRHRRPGPPVCFKWIAEGLCHLGLEVVGNLLADLIKESCCCSCLDDEHDQTGPSVTEGDQSGPGPSATDTQPGGIR